MDGLPLYEMLLRGWPVLSVLGLMSLVSGTLIVERWLALRRARANAGAFVARLLELLANGGRAAAIDLCDRTRKPAAAAAAAVLRCRGAREDRERAMRHAVQGQIRGLERGVPVLGTVASTAPFVGLLGTVIGIIKAFREIALQAGGGAEVVSAGIAEALVTTAVGLIVAIPAVMAYNFFVQAIRRLAQEIDLALFRLVEAPDGEDRP